MELVKPNVTALTAAQTKSSPGSPAKAWPLISNDSTLLFFIVKIGCNHRLTIKR